MNHTPKNIIHSSQDSRGFVVLFTVLIASIVLALALGIFNTSYKELQLTYSARESQYSFSAADAGAECALYYDLQLGNFTTDGSTTVAAAVPECNGEGVNEKNPTESYNFQFDTGARGCALVSVDKDYAGTDTRIISRGYNTTCKNISDFDELRITERVLSVTYTNLVE